MASKYRLFSADSHLEISPERWTERVPVKYRDRAPRLVKLANGTLIGLTDPQVSKDLRLGLRKSTCARFTTVLGPGSDGYHEDHVHVDLAERTGGPRLCHGEVREPGEEPAAAVPLPVPRPASANHDDND